jgi:hypothetical protein
MGMGAAALRRPRAQDLGLALLLAGVPAVSPPVELKMLRHVVFDNKQWLTAARASPDARLKPVSISGLGRHVRCFTAPALAGITP